MTTHSSRHGNRQYRFYVCTRYQKQGAASCPGSRAPVTDLEDFVVSQIRHIGKDTKILRATIEAAKKQLKAKKPELTADLNRLGKEKHRLEKERQNLLDAVAGGVKGNGAVLGRLGETEVALQGLKEKVDAVQGELVVLEGQVINEGDLKQALESFTPIWEELFPAERARVLQLLIEKVTYNAQEGEVEIRFRPGGVRSLASEKETS